MKIVGAILGGVLGVVLSIWAIMTFWGAVILPLIPINEYAGLIKLAVGFVMLWLFGGLTFMFIIVVGGLFTMLAALIIPDKLQ